ncbi:hypothetical protein HOY80DRAFT_952795 [Tuber brumale]|nr:hypothetical protein HOY80DRAFT_952795 [Tuber brumale]
MEPHERSMEVAWEYLAPIWLTVSLVGLVRDGLDEDGEGSRAWKVFSCGLTVFSFFLGAGLAPKDH